MIFITLLLIHNVFSWDAKWQPIVIEKSGDKYRVEINGQTEPGANVSIPLDQLPATELGEDTELELSDLLKGVSPPGVDDRGKIEIRMLVPLAKIEVPVTVIWQGERRNYQFSIDVESEFLDQETRRQLIARKKERGEKQGEMQSDPAKPVEAKLESPMVGQMMTIGLGFNGQAFKQQADAVNLSLDYKLSGQSAFIGYEADINDNWGVQTGVSIVTGEVLGSAAIQVQDGGFQWLGLSVDGLYSINPDFLPFWQPQRFHFLAGVQYQQLPILKRQGASSVSVVSASYSNLSLGLALRDEIIPLWELSSYVRYQLGIGSDSQFQLTPKLCFDGSLGVSRLLSPGLSLGFFGHGQSLKYSYTTYDELVSQEIDGIHELFFSAWELRLNYFF